MSTYVKFWRKTIGEVICPIPLNQVELLPVTATVHLLQSTVDGLLTSKHGQ